jgi:branched-chain amino acid transport system ATP-binding protein
MLILKNIHVAYLGIVPLLNGISMKIEDGQVVAILGANGAGKSITLNAISGLVSSELGDFSLTGRIEYDGQQIDKKLPEEIVKMGIIQVMEGHKVLDELTAMENLIIGGHMCSQRSEVKKRLNLVYEYFPRLKELQEKRAGYLSGGEQQMLVIGRAMMARPKIMLLDEISFGLAPLLIRRIFEIVRRINAETGTSILIAEQNIRAALSIANFVYLMASGKIVIEGPTEKFMNEDTLKEFYIGFSKSYQRKVYREMRDYKYRKNKIN